MKKLLIFLGVIIVLIITCPTADDHKEAIKNAVKEAASREINTYAGESGNLGFLVDTFSSGLVSGLTSLALEGFLTVDKYFVCSVGRINYGGEQKVVSVGMLNYVYTFSADDLTEAMDSAE